MSVYENYEKTGYKKMLSLAKTLCRLVQTFEVIIRAKFPESVPILALLDAIKVLCELLPAADDEFTTLTMNVTPPESDAELTPGFDPSAPAAVDPDFV